MNSCAEADYWRRKNTLGHVKSRHTYFDLPKEISIELKVTSTKESWKHLHRGIDRARDRKQIYTTCFQLPRYSSISGIRLHSRTIERRVDKPFASLKGHSCQFVQMRLPGRAVLHFRASTCRAAFHISIERGRLAPSDRSTLSLTAAIPPTFTTLLIKSSSQVSTLTAP